MRRAAFEKTRSEPRLRSPPLGKGKSRKKVLPKTFIRSQLYMLNPAGDPVCLRPLTLVREGEVGPSPRCIPDQRNLSTFTGWKESDGQPALNDYVHPESTGD